MSAPAPANGSARATLLTILGEAVLPNGGKVWQETLVRALETVGTTASAARQVVARAARDGWLTSERVGRRSLMTISDDTWQRLVEARERLFAFGAPVEWDGRWLLITLSVPEEHRDLRYQIRAQLAWMGFGSLGNGMWISPHTKDEDATVRLLRSASEPVDALVFIAQAAHAHDPREVAAAAWDLDTLRDRYIDFQRTYAGMKPRTPPAIFGSWIQLITAWRQFPGIDPELPDSLLSGGWPRQAASELFHRLHDDWLGPARDYFLSLDGS